MLDLKRASRILSLDSWINYSTSSVVDSERRLRSTAIFRIAYEHSHYAITIICSYNATLVFDHLSRTVQIGLVNFTGKLGFVRINQFGLAGDVSIQYGSIQLDALITQSDVLSFRHCFSVADLPNIAKNLCHFFFQVFTQTHESILLRRVRKSAGTGSSN